jgi:hypothetical protein
MRFVMNIVWVTLAVTLFSARGISQNAENNGAAREREMFAKNEFFAKGGVGIISENLYIVVKSAKNELVLSTGGKWVGLDASKPEVVIFFEGRIWSPQGLPDRFNLSNAVVVSFERDKIRFFDFRKMSGGYYRRPGQN